jgi:sialic acid synthase SpsE
MRREFSAEGRQVGPDHPPLVIAEIGINHEGSYDKAIELVDAANAEVVKFQCHITEHEMIPTDMTPGEISSEKRWDIIKRCELNEDEERRVQNFCRDKNITYSPRVSITSGRRSFLKRASIGLRAIRRVRRQREKSEPFVGRLVI